MGSLISEPKGLNLIKLRLRPFSKSHRCSKWDISFIFFLWTYQSKFVLKLTYEKSMHFRGKFLNKSHFCKCLSFLQMFLPKTGQAGFTLGQARQEFGRDIWNAIMVPIISLRLRCFIFMGTYEKIPAKNGRNGQVVTHAGQIFTISTVCAPENSFFWFERLSLFFTNSLISLNFHVLKKYNTKLIPFCQQYHENT